MVLRELLVGVPTVDVGVARERLPRRAEALEQLRSLRVGRAVVNRDLARVQQATPPVPAWPLTFVVKEVVRQDVLRQHFGEGARSPYGLRRPVPSRADVGEPPVDQPVTRRDVPKALPDLVIVGIAAVPDEEVGRVEVIPGGRNERVDVRPQYMGVG